MAASFRHDTSPALLDIRAGEQYSVSDEQQRDLFALRSDPSRVAVRLLKPTLAWSLIYRVAVHDVSAQPAQAGGTTAERGTAGPKPQPLLLDSFRFIAEQMQLCLQSSSDKPVRVEDLCTHDF